MEEAKKNKIIEEVREAESIPAMIAVLNKYYDLDNFKLSFLYQSILIRNLFSIIDIIKPKERE